MKKIKLNFFYLALIFYGFFGVAGKTFGADWYVDNSVDSSGNGQSWVTAWKNFSNVVWGLSGVKAGDTLYISGGSTSATYTATANNMLTVGASGSSGLPIAITTGAKSPSPSGHDGLVVFDGGGNYHTLINTALRDYITIDGEKSGEINWKFQNVSMSSADNAAIDFSSATYFFAKYLEIVTIPMGMYGTFADYSDISYCNIHDIRMEAAIRTIISAPSATDYGRTKLHHNTIQVNTAAPDGYGPDGFQTGESTDIYNNTFISADGNISGAQHPDYVQMAGHYTRIYNNTFRNPIDSAVDIAPVGNMDSYCDHIQIYNNLFVCDSTISAQASWPSGIRLYDDDGVNVSNFLVANNTFVDWGATSSKAGYPMRFVVGAAITVSTTEIKNNIFFNSGSGSYEAVLIEASSGATEANWGFDYNLVNAGSGGSAAVYVDGLPYIQAHSRVLVPTFTLYSDGSASNVYTLSAIDVAAKDQGSDLSSYYIADKEGNTRSGTWDIGAYEYVGADIIPPSVPSGLAVE